MTALLRELYAQAPEVSGSCSLELRVVHDPLEVEREALERLLPGDVSDALPLELLAAPRQRYYGLKLAGAKASRGDILLFVDSDVIPEPGFLSALLEPMIADEQILVACGTTYVDPRRNLFEKAFAAFWLFPPRAEDGPPRRADEFLPNCAAFRRELFERMPFPQVDGFRHAGAYLSAELNRAGVAIWSVPRARVKHPPPRGPRHALERALQEGHDRFEDRIRQRRRVATPMRAIRGFRTSLATNRRRTLASFRRVGLARHQLPAALAIAASYELAVRLGFVLTRIDRRIIHAITGSS